jgi:hypothetical protein
MQITHAPRRCVTITSGTVSHDAEVSGTVRQADQYSKYDAVCWCFGTEGLSGSAIRHQSINKIRDIDDMQRAGRLAETTKDILEDHRVVRKSP